jgi:hypothetical protein
VHPALAALEIEGAVDVLYHVGIRVRSLLLCLFSAPGKAAAQSGLHFVKIQMFDTWKALLYPTAESYGVYVAACSPSVVAPPQVGLYF